MTKPNLKEIEWAISDLEEQETSESRYILLAALHICRDHMLENALPQPQASAYSGLSAPLLSDQPLDPSVRCMVGYGCADGYAARRQYQSVRQRYENIEQIVRNRRDAVPACFVTNSILLCIVTITIKF